MIALFRRGDCRSHRAALLEFASHRSGGPAVRRALDHVDRCAACEDELAATTLVLHALRRLHDETRRAEPPADGWARLRARLAATRREPSRVLSGLPGIVVAAGLCAALVGPGALSSGGVVDVYDEAPRVPGSRLYDPPARLLTAQIVTILAGSETISRPRRTRAFAILPSATDRSEPDRARIQAPDPPSQALPRVATAS
jgi:hypothetical protein